MLLLKECSFDLIIQVINEEDGASYMWTEDKFTDRLYLMKDLHNIFAQTGELNFNDREKDPFLDENERIFIGMGFYMLKGLAYMFDNPCEITLVGNLNEQTGGKLLVNLVPTDATGNREIPNEMNPDDPMETGNLLDFILEL